MDAAPTSDGGPRSSGIDAAAAERRAARNKAARNRKQRRVRSTLIERQLRIQDLEQQLERALNTARGQPPAAAAPTTQPPAALPAQRGGFESPLPPELVPERVSVQSHMHKRQAVDGAGPNGDALSDAMADAFGDAHPWGLPEAELMALAAAIGREREESMGW